MAVRAGDGFEVRAESTLASRTAYVEELTQDDDWSPAIRNEKLLGAVNHFVGKLNDSAMILLGVTSSNIGR